MGLWEEQVHSQLTGLTVPDVYLLLRLQMRRLARELVAKERSIAALKATNRMHKQQLQQLAQSAVQAGLQVTPQHLLHIADHEEPNSPAAQRDNGTSNYASLLATDTASRPATAGARVQQCTAAGMSPTKQQRPAGRGSGAGRPGVGSPSVTPLAELM